jgi:hypothetical protein
MSWVRVDDGFAEHPKILELDDRTFRIHVWALCYCARHLTDGLLVLGVLRGCPLVTRKYTLDRVLRCLVGAGLWKEVDGGYIIRDFLDYNPDRAQVLENRRLHAERQARYRERQKRPRNAAGDASPKKGVTHPPTPPPKAGERDAAPRGASLPLNDCMRCGERRPLSDHDGSLLCDECERAAA